MAVNLVNLVPGSVLGTSTATYYTATNVTATIRNATVTNTTAGAVTVAVYIVPSGGSAGVSNEKIAVKSVAAGETYLCPELIGANVMNGGTIQAVSGSGASLTFMVSGYEVT
jgi:flavoprotein